MNSGDRREKESNVAGGGSAAGWREVFHVSRRRLSVAATPPFLARVFIPLLIEPRQQQSLPL